MTLKTTRMSDVSLATALKSLRPGGSARDLFILQDSHRRLCHACHENLDESATFCPTCGEHLGEYKTLPTCGKCYIAVEDVVCPKCGGILSF